MFNVQLVSVIALGVQSFPYGGWGPGEGFGHTGSNPPKENPNAAYGYDYEEILGDRFNYT